MVEVTRLVPVDATDEMVAAALACNWEYEDEVGLVHNIWHAMCAAAALDPKTASQFWNRRAQQLTAEIERLEKALETAREALEPFARIKPVSISLADDHIASSAFHRADEVYRTLSQKKEG